MKVLELALQILLALVNFSLGEKDVKEKRYVRFAGFVVSLMFVVIGVIDRGIVWS